MEKHWTVKILLALRWGANLRRTGLCGLALSMVLTRAPAADVAPSFDTNHVMAIELTVAPADWKALRYQHREAEFFPEESSATRTNAYTWFPAEALIDGKAVGRVDVRKKGYIGSNDAKRPALKLRLSSNVRSNAHLPFSELTLNNNSQDQSLIRQSIAYEVFRRAGVPAPRCSFARVTVNGRPLGIYTRVETINAAFLTDNFGRADGNLYEGGRSDFRPGWFENFELKNNQSTNHRSDLQAVTKAVAEAPGSLLPTLEKYFDPEQFFRFWAVESLVNQSDGYAGNMNNFFLFHHPGTDRFVFIPWGADSALYSGRGLNRTKGDPKSVIGVSILANRLYNSTDGAERYRATLRRILEGPWNEEILLREVSRLEALLAPQLKSDVDDFKSSVEQVRQFITHRRAELLPELNGAVPELKSKPLELAKRRKIGHVEASFSTAWRKVDPSGTNGVGQAKLSGKLWDKDLGIQSVIVQAGGMGGGPPSETQPIIAFTANRGDQQLVVYLSIEPECYEPGTPIPIDNTHIFGACMETDGRGQNSKMLGMLRGTLLLSSASREPDGKVQGEFKADIFSKLPQPR